MNKINLFSYAMAGVVLTSCIRHEAPNMQAEIESATITNADKVLQISPTITANNIVFQLREYSGNMLFAPEFLLSAGATISPASGTTRDFSQPQTYIVSSEDGAWQKTYTVSFITNDNTAVKHYAFENVELEGNYHKFFDEINGQKRYDWVSANAGFALLSSSTPASGYPTTQVANGFSGNAVKLETKSTGWLGNLVRMPIAAGNFFTGTFVASLGGAVNGTQFGMPYLFSTAPKSITGYYKYTAGASYTKTDRTSTRTTDIWDGYAILFEKNNANPRLSATHNFQDARMVSVARLNENQRTPASDWTKFEIPFEYVNGKSFDPNTEYMIAIVFTSSTEGAKFNGAVGSTLYIDEIEIITE